MLDFGRGELGGFWIHLALVGLACVLLLVGLPSMHKALGFDSQHDINWAWSCIPVMAAFERWKEDQEFKATLSYIEFEVA